MDIRIFFFCLVILFIGCSKDSNCQTNSNSSITKYLEAVETYLTDRYLNNYDLTDSLKVYPLGLVVERSGDIIHRQGEEPAGEAKYMNIKDLEFYPTRISLAKNWIMMQFNFGIPVQVEIGKRIKKIADAPFERLLIVGKWDTQEIYSIDVGYSFCDSSFRHREEFVVENKLYEWTIYEKTSLEAFLEMVDRLLGNTLTKSSTKLNLENLDDCEKARALFRN